MADDGQRPKTLRRYDKAAERRRAWDGILDDAYRFALPNHDPRGNQSPGKQRDVEVFDNTAVAAVQWRKARLHGQLFPPFRKWMDFTIQGDDPGDDDQIKAYLAKAQEAFHQAIEVSNFHIEIDPALGDACISTGCLMIHQGTPEDPLRFEAVPIAQLIPEEGLDGTLRTMFRHWSLPLRQIREKWPDAKRPEQIKQRDDPDAPITVIEAILHEGDIARYEVWATDTGQGQGSGARLMLERNYQTSPAIAFRMDKAPGEWMGRGPVLNVLGDIKTANKLVELVLKNASIAVTGMWQADDDGVLNTANIKLVPGTIIPKAPGSGGLQPLKAPGDFNVSQILLEPLQENIRRGIMGPALPPTREGVRTATEIDARVAEHEAFELPISLRLLNELDYPLARRVIAILSSPAMAGSPYYIEPLERNGQELRPVPVSPLVRLQDRAEAAQAGQAYAAGLQMMGDIIGGVVNRPTFLRHSLTQAGFPPEHLLSEDQAAQYEAQVRHAQAQMQAQERMKQERMKQERMEQEAEQREGGHE
ncbi:MAG: portal protein [Pseudomonadota bacterium]